MITIVATVTIVIVATITIVAMVTIVATITIVAMVTIFATITIVATVTIIAEFAIMRHFLLMITTYNYWNDRDNSDICHYCNAGNYCDACNNWDIENCGTNSDYCMSVFITNSAKIPNIFNKKPFAMYCTVLSKLENLHKYPFTEGFG